MRDLGASRVRVGATEVLFAVPQAVPRAYDEDDDGIPLQSAPVAEQEWLEQQKKQNEPRQIDERLTADLHQWYQSKPLPSVS